MAQEDRKRRYHERWVNCAAAEAAYTQLSTQQREFKKLTELGRPLLARIRGREKKGVIQQTTLMQLQNIQAIANRCGVPLETLLANGDGMNPLKVSTVPPDLQLLKEQVPETPKNKHMLEEIFSKDPYYNIYSNGMIVQNLEMNVPPNTTSLFVVYPVTFPHKVINIDVVGIHATKQEATPGNCRLIFSPAPVARKIELIFFGI